jgi:hypothetical protein
MRRQSQPKGLRSPMFNDLPVPPPCPARVGMSGSGLQTSLTFGPRPDWLMKCSAGSVPQPFAGNGKETVAGLPFPPALYVLRPVRRGGGGFCRASGSARRSPRARQLLVCKPWVGGDSKLTARRRWPGFGCELMSVLSNQVQQQQRGPSVSRCIGQGMCQIPPKRIC